MIKISTIFGEDAVREYEENNELPSEEWLADNGGVEKPAAAVLQQLPFFPFLPLSI